MSASAREDSVATPAAGATAIAAAATGAAAGASRRAKAKRDCVREDSGTAPPSPRPVPSACGLLAPLPLGP
jgi:hypothetical protein